MSKNKENNKNSNIPIFGIPLQTIKIQTDEVGFTPQQRQIMERQRKILSEESIQKAKDELRQKDPIRYSVEQMREAQRKNPTSEVIYYEDDKGNLQRAWTKVGAMSANDPVAQFYVEGVALGKPLRYAFKPINSLMRKIPIRFNKQIKRIKNIFSKDPKQYQKDLKDLLALADTSKEIDDLFKQLIKTRNTYYRGSNSITLDQLNQLHIGKRTEGFRGGGLHGEEFLDEISKQYKARLYLSDSPGHAQIFYYRDPTTSRQPFGEIVIKEPVFNTNNRQQWLLDNPKITTIDDSGLSIIPYQTTPEGVTNYIVSGPENTFIGTVKALPTNIRYKLDPMKNIQLGKPYKHIRKQK